MQLYCLLLFVVFPGFLFAGNSQYGSSSPQMPLNMQPPAPMPPGPSNSQPQLNPPLPAQPVSPSDLCSVQPPQQNGPISPSGELNQLPTNIPQSSPQDNSLGNIPQPSGSFNSLNNANQPNLGAQGNGQLQLPSQNSYGSVAEFGGWDDNSDWDNDIDWRFRGRFGGGLGGGFGGGFGFGGGCVFCPFSPSCYCPFGYFCQYVPRTCFSCARYYCIRRFF